MNDVYSGIPMYEVQKGIQRIMLYSLTNSLIMVTCIVIIGTSLVLKEDIG